MGVTWLEMDVTSGDGIEKTELQCNSIWVYLVLISYSKPLTNSLS